MFSVLFFSNNMFSSANANESIFTGLVWHDKCPSIDEWYDYPVGNTQSKPCEES